MAWNSQGGGGGPWSRGPNGGGQSPWGGGKGPGGGGQPPDIDEILRRGRAGLRRLLPGGRGNNRQALAFGALALLLLWAATGIYKVNPEEVGVVLRFGRFVRFTQPGLNYHLPAPIETVLTPAVTRINRIELGYRSATDPRRPVNGRANNDESLMLTGDENIIDVNFSVFWQINDPEKYLFAIRDPEGTVKIIAESAMREIIGQLPIRAPLFENRQAIGDSTRKRMQELLDQYGSGISVTQVQLLKADPPVEVIDAFNDVQRAKADQERLRNEAEAYRNDIIPKARGDSERIVQEAEAYKEQVTDLAQGEAKRFTSVYQSYRAAPDVTARRLYIETMEQVLKDAQKVIIDPQIKSVQGYLPLPDLTKTRVPPTLLSPPAQPGVK